MRIDADCHISSRSTPSEVGPEQMVRFLDACDMDKAICWPMVAYDREMASDNLAIFKGAQQFPDRIIPVGGVNPRLGLDQAKDELQRCIQEYGVKGVKLNGARDTYYIDDPVLSLPLIEMIADAGIVLAFHCGANDFERTHPFRIAKISDMYPDLNIAVVHMGGGGLPSIHDATIELAAKYPNWYLIDSECDYRKVLAAFDALGASRVCYGSDTPFCPMRYEYGMRDVIYQDLSDQDKALVYGGNTARMLGL